MKEYVSNFYNKNVGTNPIWRAVDAENYELKILFPVYWRNLTWWPHLKKRRFEALPTASLDANALTSREAAREQIARGLNILTSDKLWTRLIHPWRNTLHFHPLNIDIVFTTSWVLGMLLPPAVYYHVSSTRQAFKIWPTALRPSNQIVRHFKFSKARLSNQSFKKNVTIYFDYWTRLNQNLDISVRFVNNISYVFVMIFHTKDYSSLILATQRIFQSWKWHILTFLIPLNGTLAGPPWL